ncbi:hypothetical protein D3C84_1144690 [compost metagenome]|jgi:ribosomal protein L37E
MAGKMCPQCSRLTFHGNEMKRECSKCGFTSRRPANEGKGGKGKLCGLCSKFTVFNNHCSNPACGAVSTYGKKVT